MNSGRMLRLLCLAATLGAPGAVCAEPVVSTAVVPGTPPRGDYLVGAGDDLLIWVWKNPDLSVDVPVRPDGKIGVPLIDDVQARGKTPSEIAAEVRGRMSMYVQDPVVSVLVKTFSSATNDAAIRVIGAAATPKTVAYRTGLTALDVIIEAGGLTIYADGDRAKLIRRERGGYATYPLHLKRLVKAADLSADVALAPGDVIRIPERWF